MRIKEFEVKNYKSLENVVLKDLGDFNVLIGKNSSGKTNILEAMNMFFATFTTEFKKEVNFLDERYWYGKDKTKEIVFRVTISLNENETKRIGGTIGEILGEDLISKDLEIDIKVKINSDKANVYRVIEEIELKDVLHIDSAKIYRFKKSKKEEIPINEDLKNAVLSDIANLLRESFFYIPVNRYSPESSSLERKTIVPDDVFYKIVELHEKTDPASEALYDKIKEYLQRIPTLKNKLDYKGRKIFVTEGISIPIENVGGGDQEVLRLVYYIVTKNGIICIEEPESHLHAELVRALHKIFLDCSQQTQIFITTHSPIFVDLTNRESIWLVSIKDKCTTVKKVKEISGFKEIAFELGIRPSDIFFAGRIVFVEGLSDKIYFENIARRLGVFNSDVVMLPIKGKNNAKRHLKMWSQMAKNVDIDFYLLLDNDAEKEINALLEEDIITEEMCHLLTLGCLEDYYPQELAFEALYGILADEELSKNVMKTLEQMLNKGEKLTDIIKQITKKTGINENRIKCLLAEWMSTHMELKEVNRELKKVLEKVYTV